LRIRKNPNRNNKSSTSFGRLQYYIQWNQSQPKPQ
jgi:hypothetical protein